MTALVVGAFYLLTGAWAFLLPRPFYGAVATFAPFNQHLLHDAGAFQVGLGLALILAALMDTGLRPALIAVLAASLLHLGAHVEDVRLGGHPATDLPILVAICVILGAGLLSEGRVKVGPEAQP